MKRRCRLRVIILARGVQVKIKTKTSRYLMFSLLHLCFVFYGEINIKKGWLCSFLLS